MPKRLLITGSRAWTDAGLVRAALQSAVVSHGVPASEITLVHGGAKGADRLAGQVGHQLGMRIEVHEAQWRRCTADCIHDLRATRSYCPEAGYRRNAEMIAGMEPGSLVLAFAANAPSGTSGCAQVARRCGLNVVDWGADTTGDRRRMVDRWVRVVQAMQTDGSAARKVDYIPHAP